MSRRLKPCFSCSQEKYCMMDFEHCSKLGEEQKEVMRDHCEGEEEFED